MTQNETFDLAGPAGRLEALLMHPDGPVEAIGVVCHAHPLHGGVMHFKPVFRAAKALQQHGVAVLRFNFRGVGRSEGSHDEGRGEQDDAAAALTEMTRRFPGVPAVLGGFSFGSSMALRVAARDQRVRAVFALGFPLAMVGDPSFVQALTIPRLFVQGDADTFGSGAQIQALVAGLPEPRRVVVIPGSDHFFEGHLDEMQTSVAAWAGERPWAVPAP